MEKPYLHTYYNEQVVPELKKQRGYQNPHEVPRLLKVVINSGINASRDKNWIEDVRKDISLLAGQRAVITKARESISNFKLREGVPIGVKVTLRGTRMYDFLLRLLAVSLPNIRDFRGLSAKLDGHGNYTLGISDHTIFPEISADTGGRDSIGMDITLVTSAETDDEARELLGKLGMPFRKRSSDNQAQAVSA